jgi:uncharacterized protein (DUF58 family)
MTDTPLETANRIPPLLSGDFLRRLELLDLVTKKILRGEVRGEKRSARKGPGVEFSDHRAYGPGDDPRTIDWNIYMRLQELRVKLFEVEENLNLALYVDSSPSMDYGERNKLRAALKIAGAIGYIGLSHFHRVCLYAPGFWTGPQTGIFAGKGGRLAFLEKAASLGPTASPADLGPFVSEILSLFRGPSLAVILSDFYDTEALAPRLNVLAGRKCDIVAIQIVDRLERDPPFRGRVLLEDAEGGEALPITATAELLAAYRQRFEAHLSRVEHMLSERKIRFARVDTRTAFDQAVLEILRRGYILGRSS